MCNPLHVPCSIHYPGSLLSSCNDQNARWSDYYSVQIDCPVTLTWFLGFFTSPSYFLDCVSKDFWCAQGDFDFWHEKESFASRRLLGDFVFALVENLSARVENLSARVKNLEKHVKRDNWYGYCSNKDLSLGLQPFAISVVFCICNPTLSKKLVNKNIHLA